MSNKRKLDIELLKSADSKFSTKEVELEVEVPVEKDGKIEYDTQTAVIEIDNAFRRTKMHACIEEFITKLFHVKRTNGQYLHDLYEPLLLFMMIKHFTSFPAPEKFTEQSKIIKMLIDNGLLYKIASEFNPKEVEKFNVLLDKVADNVEEEIEEYIEALEKSGIREKIEKLDTE